LHKAAEAIISANLRFSEELVVEGFLYFVFIYGISLIAGLMERQMASSGGLASSR
jgi:ABC-type amino acid transport system permease subunit